MTYMVGSVSTLTLRADAQPQYYLAHHLDSLGRDRRAWRGRARGESEGALEVVAVAWA
jgi:hypothetical protein